jgi:hypothetical protein
MPATASAPVQRSTALLSPPPRAMIDRYDTTTAWVLDDDRLRSSKRPRLLLLLLLRLSLLPACLSWGWVGING